MWSCFEVEMHEVVPLLTLYTLMSHKTLLQCYTFEMQYRWITDSVNHVFLAGALSTPAHLAHKSFHAHTRLG